MADLGLSVGAGEILKMYILSSQVIPFIGTSGPKLGVRYLGSCIIFSHGGGTSPTRSSTVELAVRGGDLGSGC